MLQPRLGKTGAGARGFPEYLGFQETVNMPDAAGWSRIENFVGYGRRDAPVVFIGLEEGLSQPETLQEQLAIRAGFAPVMDLKAAHASIPGTARFFDPVRPKCQRTWRPMCDLLLRREDPEHLAPTAQLRGHYQATRLGRTHGETLLTELLPYPHVRADHWVYGDRYATRQDYEAALLGERLQLLSTELAAAKRELIVCYGASRWPAFKQLMQLTFGLGAGDWSTELGGAVQVAESGGTRIVLTHHFSGRQFNSEAQLADFAQIALG